MNIIYTHDILEIGKTYHGNNTLFDADAIPHQNMHVYVLAEATRQDYIRQIAELNILIDLRLLDDPRVRYYRVSID